MPLLTGLLLLQLALGSVVAVGYGGYACPALLTCVGTWEWPQVAIQVWHMLHRILGVVVLGVAIYLCRAGWRRELLPPLTRLGCRWSMWLLATQVVLGLVTVAHGFEHKLALVALRVGSNNLPTALRRDL